MNDFAHATETPTFDTAAIARGARRKRATVIAGIATALVVAGAGTALAVGNVGNVGNSSSSHASKSTVAAASTDSTTFLVRTSDGTIAKEWLGGASSSRARAGLVHFGLTPSFTRVRKADCPKPEDAVISLSPHAPTVLHAGDTVHVTTCYR